MASPSVHPPHARTRTHTHCTPHARAHELPHASFTHRRWKHEVLSACLSLTILPSTESTVHRGSIQQLMASHDVYLHRHMGGIQFKGTAGFREQLPS